MLTYKEDSPFQRALRPVALVLSASLLAPTFLAGCGGNNAQTPPPPRDASAGEMQRMNQPAQSQGMSTRKKIVILVGAAALYYLYKKNQAARAAKQTNVQYYLSKNGRIYYRDPNKNMQAVWVTPPRGGIQVPESEAMDYRDLQGYNNNQSGRDLRGLVPMANGSF